MRITILRKNILFVILMCNAIVYAQYTEKDILNYIESYHSLAVRKMKDYGIPASITLAQGILESAAGTSDLAKEANNHFGIKCHSDWKGKTFHKDDDKKHECFRSYPSVEQSFDDHSAFLKKERYADLYNLKITDYKSWAKGLKRCGYATDPHYADRLIDLIERYELNDYDTEDYKKGNRFTGSKHPDKEKGINDRAQIEPAAQIQTVIKSRDVEFKPVNYPYTQRPVYINNNVYFIIAKRDETFYDIAVDVQLTIGQLRKFNDVPYLSYEPVEGEIVYISKKANQSDKTSEHLVKRGETLRDIAQIYACSEKALRKINALTKDDVVKEGDKIKLK